MEEEAGYSSRVTGRREVSSGCSFGPISDPGLTENYLPAVRLDRCPFTNVRGCVNIRNS